LDWKVLAYVAGASFVANMIGLFVVVEFVTGPIKERGQEKNVGEVEKKLIHGSSRDGGLAALRDIHLQYPGRFEFVAHTPQDQIFQALVDYLATEEGELLFEDLYSWTDLTRADAATEASLVPIGEAIDALGFSD